MMLFVSSWVTGLVLAFASQTSAAPAPRAQTLAGSFEYGSSTQTGMTSLNQNWYDERTGLWGGLWWNSANALTSVADFARQSPLYSFPISPRKIIETTFNEAQHAVVQTAKYMDMAKGGMVESQYCINGTGFCLLQRDGTIEKRGFRNFLNQFYDDEGWWALALIRSFDLTSDRKYLDAAVSIFKDMQTGLGGPCQGGIYWSKDRQYVNAIANELYLSVAASLANRIPNDSQYLQIATDQWNWFANSGMINRDNLINDGLDGNCRNNGQPTWTYNQGVVLGGLVELARATNDYGYLDNASKIAHAAISKMVNNDGVLQEATGCEYQPGRCGADGQQFKGIFIRNLGYLHLAAPDDKYRDFILTNANAIWSKDRDNNNKLGVAWDGPYFDASSASQSSALDALVAAISVA